MDCLKQAKLELEQQIAMEFSAIGREKNHKIHMLQVQINETFDLLSWLKSQSVYPQFYLNWRDEQKKIACIGKVRSFSSIDLAQVFVQDNAFPLVGGVQFYGESTFFLPQLMLEQREQGSILRIFVEADYPDRALQALADLDQFSPLAALDALNIKKQQAADKTLWCEWVEQALKQIRQGELSKLVLANKTDLTLEQPVDSKDFLNASEKQHSGCYHFLLAMSPKQSFVGSTPERLFARQGKELLTEALAGTAAIHQDPIVDQQQALWLLNDSKNLNENWLVVDNISHNIQPYVQQIDVSDVALKPLRNVQHLIRKIHTQLKPTCTDADILQAIHPTAAVLGLPPKKAKKMLTQLENFDRSWYAGTLGIMEKQGAEFCVAIRSAFIAERQISLFAGAGIVENSVPEEEWFEIERKAAGLMSLLLKENGEDNVGKRI